jgi:hypothetical protein
VNRSKRIVWEPPAAAAAPISAFRPVNNRASCLASRLPGLRFVPHCEWHGGPICGCCARPVCSFRYPGILSLADPLTQTTTCVRRTTRVSTSSRFGKPKDDSRICQTLGVPRQSRGVTSVTCFGTAEEYDPGTDTWTTKTDMPTARAGLSTSVVSGNIYAIGGQASDQESGLSTVEVYDPVADTWTSDADMLPTARFFFGTSL